MTQAIVLKIPGKTFIAGEYLALKGLGSLVFCSRPEFEVQIKKGVVSNNPFHPESPSGLFWLENETLFKNYSVQIKAFTGLGGWGASTAEFIALHALYQLKDTLWIEQERIFDLHQILLDYRRISGSKVSGFPPSGADLVAQVRGGLTYFDSLNGKIQTFSWPFENLKFKLLATGFKLATHEHLKTIGDFKTEALLQAVHFCHEGLKSVDEGLFVTGLQQMAQGLSDLGFVAPQTQKILERFRVPGMLAAKGCGALGADVVLVAYRDPEVGALIDRLARELQLQILASELSIGSGLNVSSNDGSNRGTP